MKVIQVVASINRDVGGPAVTVSRLAAGLSALGIDTRLATLDYDAHGSQAALGGAVLESVPASPLTRALRGWSPRFGAAIGELARRGADIVHGHGLWMFPNLYARRAAQNASVPLVVSPRGMLDEWSLRRSRWRKLVAWHLFERENLESARLFHATSAAEADSIRGSGFQQPIAVIPNGVELPVPSSIPARQLLELKFPELAQKEWLLFMSRLHPKKGLEELVRAWRELASRFPHWQLLIAGPDLDGYGAKIRSMVASHGLSARTTFTGLLHGEDKACALAQAGVLVLPTHSENFGIVVAEALAHGVPVITTRAAPWEELRVERCGWWIEDSEDALQAALCEAMSLAPGQRREMGARGRDLVARRYAWERVAVEMKSAYLWLRGAGPRPDCVREQ